MPVLSTLSESSTFAVSPNRREVSPGVFMADVLIDGEPASIQLGEKIEIIRDYDMNQNIQYKILSIRAKLPQNLSDKIRHIDDAIKEQFPELAVTPILDMYDPNHPRIDIRFDIDKNTMTLKTLIYNEQDVLQNDYGTSWKASDLSEFMTRRCLFDAKFKMEAVFIENRLKILLKASQALFCPMVEELELVSPPYPEAVFKLGDIVKVGNNYFAPLLSSNKQCLTTGSLYKPTLHDIMYGGKVLKACFETKDQQVAFQQLNSFGESLQKELSNKLSCNLTYYPIRDQPEFRIDKMRTEIEDMDGNRESHIDILDNLRNGRIDIFFSPEISINLNKSRYNLTLRTRKVLILTKDKPLPEVPSSQTFKGDIALGSVKAAGSMGNSYGHVLDAETETPCVFKDKFKPLEIKMIGNRVFLQARSLYPNILTKVDEIISKELPDNSRYFGALRDKTDTEFNIGVSENGQLQMDCTKDDVVIKTLDELRKELSNTNQIMVTYSIEYSVSEGNVKWQVILRAIQIEVLPSDTASTSKWALEVEELSNISVGVPQAIGQNGTYFGALESDGEPIIVNLGNMVIGNKHTIADSLRFIRCNPSDPSILQFLTGLDSLMRDSAMSLCESTDTPELRYFDVVKDNCVVEIRLDNRTRYINGSEDTLTDTNIGNFIVSLEYSIQTPKERYQLILKAKEIELLKPSEDVKFQSPSSSNTSVMGMPISEVMNNMEGKISFEKPSMEATSKQKFLLFRYDEKPKTFLLDPILLQREESQSVGLPSPEYEGNKLTVILRNDNLTFFEEMDSILQDSIDTIREMMEIPSNAKLSYNPIVRTDNDVPFTKFTIDVDTGKNCTQFFLGNRGNVLKCESINDVRPYIQLGTTLEDVVVCISKIWYDKMKKEYNVKLKLNSCTIKPKIGRGGEPLGFKVEV